MTDSQQPGPELDARVAKDVMGWPVIYMGHPDCDEWWERVPSYPCLVVHSDGSNWCVRSKSNTDPLDSFEPSTDIAASWEVMKELKRRGIYLSVQSMPYGWNIGDYETTRDWVTSKTEAPYAICLASLEAVEGRNDE